MKRRDPGTAVPTDDLRRALAHYCRTMGDLTADGRWSAAAAILGGRKPGRRPSDDDAAIRYARAALAAGIAKSTHQAAAMAANLMAKRPHEVDSMRDRIRRKLRAKPIKSEDTGQNRV